MTILRTYKPVIAATLIAVYIFIATPVQYWHQHKSTGKPEIAASKLVICVKSNDKSTEAGCSICSHQYSSYYDNTSTPVLPLITVHAAQNGNLVFSFIPFPVFSLFNKGPPSLS